ncbi:holin [Gordonia phage BrutonGaster]|uniref:Holin n=1 Tax=Gordonia phage BrutonGaster TaxID=2530116 RepID=A0A482JLK5_9CAUD|nr:holin [Gordonia phage BrutonGaster]QBP33257.1 holin [Gordonia phage BrutonGaster]
MNLFNIRSWSDVRAFLYVILPVLSSFLVTNGTLTENEASLWTGLVTAILGPVIAFAMTRGVSGFRTAFYALLGAGQALLVGYGIWTGAELDAWMPLISTLIGAGAGGVAVSNTPVTTLFSHGQLEAEAEKAPVVR